MLELIREHDSLMGWIVTMYFLVIPMICNMAWQESGLSFIKWYFTKSDSVNWLGFSCFIFLGLGCFIWYIGLLILELIFYVVVLPIYWLFEFMFLNKDCSHMVCEELDDKNKK